jgi:uncharacterized protein (TIGR01777 family)
MRILVSGSTGLVGTALKTALRDQGDQVDSLVRPETRAGQRTRSAREERDVLWNPATGLLDSSAEGADAVVHLAGSPIAAGRWTSARKRLLRESRIPGTRNLVGALGRLRRPPTVFVAASAIGYYGGRGDEQLTENSAPGTDFLAQLSRDWEAESSRAADFGARVVIVRFGIILAKHGGALPKIAAPFRLGAGGRLGSGQQWMSWVTLEDIVGILRYALATNLLSGVANGVSPTPVRNVEFAETLGSVMRRPALFPTPAFMLRLAVGEMADALLLSSQRVIPAKLDQLGYRFVQPELRDALTAIMRSAR